MCRARESRLEQLGDGEPLGLGVAGAAGAQLLVPLVEVLRQLVDDLGLARRPQPQRGQPRPQVLAPVRHGRLR